MYKRLESGTIEAIRHNDGQPVVTIDATELAMLISDISFSLVHQAPQTLPRRLGRRWRGTSGSEDGVLTAEIDFRAGDVIDW